jgi:hypothetical protein
LFNIQLIAFLATFLIWFGTDWLAWLVWLVGLGRLGWFEAESTSDAVSTLLDILVF